jgi:hypothetical protein
MKPVPREAYTTVSGFEAKKHAIRQTTDGLWQLTLTVHEFGNADWLVFAPMGTPLAVGLKAMDYDNPEQPTEEDPRKKYIQRSVMMCKNEKFQRYFEQRASEEGFYDWGVGEAEVETANALRTFLGISSRSELAHVDRDDVRFQMDELVKDFKSWIAQTGNTG